MKSNILQRLKNAWKHQRKPDVVKSFNADQQAEAAFDTFNRGRCRVPLNQIVGSVGRYHDFDSKFRPKQHMPTDRLESIKKVMCDGKRLPPVKLYQIKDEYYVLDGNHRIAAAKALRHNDIDATIVEFIPSKNTLEHIIYKERAAFSEQTGLQYAINLTELGQYDIMLQQITRHRVHLEKTEARPFSIQETAADWYESIYRPLMTIIRKGMILNFFPDRTLDDLYVYVSGHQWLKAKQRRYGIGIDRLIPKDMEEFRDKMAKIRESEYPEMLREITAFILMNVKGKNEHRIVDKLFSLKEVRELHSIHGTADLLVKIVLTRDLLSSDAEIISEFVQDQMRQIPGVVSTQTLIPGQSLIK